MHDSKTDLKDRRYKWVSFPNGYDYRVTPLGWQGRKQPPMTFVGKLMLTLFYVSVIVCVFLMK
jgi:hypothetical protein